MSVRARTKIEHFVQASATNALEYYVPSFRTNSDMLSWEFPERFARLVFFPRFCSMTKIRHSIPPRNENTVEEIFRFNSHMHIEQMGHMTVFMYGFHMRTCDTKTKMFQSPSQL